MKRHRQHGTKFCVQLPRSATVRFKAPCGHTIRIPKCFDRQTSNYFGCGLCRVFFKYPHIPLQPDPGPMRNYRVGLARDERLPDGPGPFEKSKGGGLRGADL